MVRDTTTRQVIELRVHRCLMAAGALLTAVALLLLSLLPSAPSEAVAMTAYGQQRNDAIRDTFRITRELAQFPHPRRFAELQRDLSRALDVEARQLAARPEPALALSVC